MRQPGWLGVVFGTVADVIGIEATDGRDLSRVGLCARSTEVTVPLVGDVVTAGTCFYGRSAMLLTVLHVLRLRILLSMFVFGLLIGAGIVGTSLSFGLSLRLDF